MNFFCNELTVMLVKPGSYLSSNDWKLLFFIKYSKHRIYLSKK